MNRTVFITIGAIAILVVVGGVMFFSTKSNDPAVPQDGNGIVDSSGTDTPRIPVINMEDIDEDGISNDEEKSLGLNDKEYDTDRDGLSDSTELRITNTDPKLKDTDGDGLTDGQEYLLFNSDPTNIDSDGDSYSDGTEVENGYSPIGPGRL